MTEQNGNFLDRNAILNISDVVIEEVYIKPWNSKVRVRSMNAGQRGRLEASMVERKGINVVENMSLLKIRMAILSVVDEQGKRMFTDADIDALKAKNAQAIDIIFDVARRLSGFTAQDVTELTETKAESEASEASDVR